MLRRDEKNVLYQQADKLLTQKIKNVVQYQQKTREIIENLKKEIQDMKQNDKIALEKIKNFQEKKLEEITLMIDAPYFTHCIVEFDDKTEESMFFGKFSLSDQYIYSWVTPVASLRFSKPGKVSYKRLDGTYRTGTLCKKDQYLIVDGNIVYLSTESEGHDRELVYQSYFSTQKTDFALPEIVAQMEKAQDDVIRASFKGSLIISGPAGSGKTTLALHRVAYLVQSPDVSDFFSPTSIIVLVQDEGTKTYFSKLLPQLGINGVQITTFPTWACNVLGIKGVDYIYRYGETEAEKDHYEFIKNLCLRNLSSYELQSNFWQTLKNIYQKTNIANTFEKQKKENVLDRFDLTILLCLYKKANKKLTMIQEYYQMKKTQEAIKKTGRFPISYSLIIFDEFQNYLPEQLSLIKSTIDEQTNSVMYIGDLAQQTQIGTIHEWKQIGEDIPEKRQIKLQKVYRNTKQILEYIQSQGYRVEVAKEARNGYPVIDKTYNSVDDEYDFISHLVEKENNIGTVGILAKNKMYLSRYKQLEQVSEKKIHVLSIHEAQGVEFDTVCLVGEQLFFQLEGNTFSEKQQEEKERINKDLRYVGLTRAMNRLVVTRVLKT